MSTIKLEDLNAFPLEEIRKKNWIKIMEKRKLTAKSMRLEKNST